MKYGRRATGYGLRSERGVTLVELVISITIVSIASAAVLGVMTITTRGSADAMVRYQQVAIGNAYLEEILLKSFVDPNCVDGEGARAAFDDIDDYNGLTNAGAQDQFGNPLDGLGQYNVTVAVASTMLGNPANLPSLQATVTVSHPAGAPMVFAGYRTNPSIPCVP